MASHNVGDLEQMQSLSLESKIIMTKQRIKAWYDYWDGDVYVSISGGKDSQVLAHIVKEMYDDVPLVFINTGLEYDSVRLKGFDLADTVLTPKLDFVNVIKKYGYPVISKEISEIIRNARNYDIVTGKYKYSMDKLNGNKLTKNGEKSSYNVEKWKFLLDAPFKISNQCCNQMKKKPSKTYEDKSKRRAFIGTLAEESRLRRTEWMRHGCNSFDGKRPTSKPLSFWTEQDILRYIYT